MEHRNPTKRFGFPKYCFSDDLGLGFSVLIEIRLRLNQPTVKPEI